MLLSFNYYGLSVGIATIVAIWLWEKRLSQLEIKFKKPNLVLFFILAAAVFGARLWHVLTDWQLYQPEWWRVVAISQGGLSIFGAILGLISGLYFVAKWQKVRFVILLDVLALSLPFAQAIGRWGNYFNQELFGLPTNLPWSIMAAGQKVHPIFLYESISMLLLGIYLNKKFDVKRVGHGYYFFVYSAVYLILRFFLDFLRVQKAMFNNSLGINQVIVLFLLVILTMMLVYQKKYGKKH